MPAKGKPWRRDAMEVMDVEGMRRLAERGGYKEAAPLRTAAHGWCEGYAAREAA